MRAIVLLCLLPMGAFAGGMEEPPPYEDPCTVLPSEAAYKAGVIGMDPEEAWQLHLVLARARCGTPEPLFKVLGWTDEQILRSVFNGHHVPKPHNPAPIPLPGGTLTLLTGLAALIFLKRKKPA